MANKAEKTQVGYKQRLKPITDALGKLLVCDITVSDVVEYRTVRLEKVSNRTVNHEIAFYAES